MRFEEIARQLVETTSRLVRGRIINIMDTEGRIVASTEESRIGTLHAGACEVVRTGRPVAIEPADLARWPGAREGYNLPVFSDGRLIAVVGIFGEPEQVRDSAYILAAYTEQFFHQNALDQQNRITGELRTTYLRLLLNLDRYGTEELTEVGEALGLRLQFPVRVLALEFCGRQDALVCRQRLYRAVEELQFQNLLDPKRDVWAVTGDRLLMLKSDTGTRCLHRMLTCAETAVGAPARLGAGRPCQTLRQAPQSGAQALTLCAAPVSGVQDIQDPDCRFLYLMQRTAFREEDCIREMHSLLEQQLDAGELEMLLATADAYYDCGGSVGQAADRLHIVLIGISSVASLPALPFGDGVVYAFLNFIGNPVIALMLGVFLSLTLIPASERGNTLKWVTQGVTDSAAILAITGAGGSFGAILKLLPIADATQGLLATGLGVLVPFTIAMILKLAMGASTVAMITTASMVAPMLENMGLTSPLGRVFVVMAIGAGSMVASHANDSYFWVVSQFSDMKTGEAYRCQTGMTAVMGVTVVAILYVLSLFLF